MNPSTARKLYLLEIIIGVISMLLGILISILVWHDGYFMGALMLVVTGCLSSFLGWKEYKGWSGSPWQETFILVLRRTFLFMNAMLSLLVIGTLISMFI